MMDRCWLDPNAAQNMVTVITGVVYSPSTDNFPSYRARRMETLGVSMDGAGQWTPPEHRPLRIELPGKKDHDHDDTQDLTGVL